MPPLFFRVENMTKDLCLRLEELAEKYETADFVKEDPSQFLRWYTQVRDVEVAAFTAAMLSFGNRKQFIPKIKYIFECADKAGGLAQWLYSGDFENSFFSPDGNDEKKFYRFYSYFDMKIFFRSCARILKSAETFGEFFRIKAESRDAECSVAVCVLEEIAKAFGDCAIVPKGKCSANKRVHMFLRWMVRKNSPVDLGLWKWFDESELIIPLDTHVLQEAIKMGIISEKDSGSYKTAVKITEALKEIWPEDPCRGDFALFGLGVDAK